MTFSLTKHKDQIRNLERDLKAAKRNRDWELARRISWQLKTLAANR